MTVYMVYVLMNEHEYKIANRYGQYDLFQTKNGRFIDGVYCTLWGFTDSKEIKKRFLEERDIHRRFLIQKKELSESEYSNFMMDYFRFELLPIYFDNRRNIGEKSGFQKDFIIKTKIDKLEEDDYVNRIATKYEFDFIANNLGEICTSIEKRLFTSNLPMNPNVFVSPIRDILKLMCYDYLSVIYNPNASKYLLEANLKGDILDICKYFTGDKIEGLQDLFSMSRLFYHVFAEVIYREVIE